jgi:hypothetical protein
MNYNLERKNNRKYGSKFEVISDMDEACKYAEEVMVSKYGLERWNKEKISLNLVGDEKSPLSDH